MLLPIEMSPQRTLWCQKGEHQWNRPVQKGKTPFSCPDHRKRRSRTTVTDADPVTVLKPEPIVEPVQEPVCLPTTAREKTIQQLLDRRASCTCKIDFTMSDDELQAVESCAHGYICPVLDSIRRRVVDYGRHLREMDKEEEPASV